MITREEYGLLKEYRRLGYKWIARDKNGRLFVYQEIPRRYRKTWNFGGVVVNIRGEYFTFIKWEDEKPTKIDDLIRNYESNQVITSESVNKTELVKEIEDIFYNIGIHDYRIGERCEITTWGIDSKTIRKILSAIEKCSIEKEKLYTVRLVNGDYLCRFKSVGIDWAKGQDYKNDKNYQLTQSEIESIDPILMKVAKEVE